MQFAKTDNHIWEIFRFSTYIHSSVFLRKDRKRCSAKVSHFNLLLFF